MTETITELVIDLDSATGLAVKTVAELEFGVEPPGISFGLPGPAGPVGPTGPIGVVTYPSGAEPDLAGVPDGTLFVEYEP